MHAKVTVTGVLFQPLLLGLGVAVAVIIGGVIPIFSVTFAVLVFPALSVAVPVMTWFAPSVLTTMGAVQV